MTGKNEIATLFLFKRVTLCEHKYLVNIHGLFLVDKKGSEGQLVAKRHGQLKLTDVSRYPICA